MDKSNGETGLIAYGSYAPGDDNHGVLAHLPGQWRKGWIRGGFVEAPDGLHRADHLGWWKPGIWLSLMPTAI